MKVLVLAGLVALASVAVHATETKKTTTTTTKHAADHSHTEEGAKADHAHDDAHHMDAATKDAASMKKVETKTEKKK